MFVLKQRPPRGQWIFGAIGRLDRDVHGGDGELAVAAQ